MIRLPPHPAALAILKTVLEAEEIPHFFPDENIHSLYGSLGYIHPPRLQVPKDQADRVRDLLSSLESDSLLPEPDED